MHALKRLVTYDASVYIVTMFCSLQVM